MALTLRTVWVGTAVVVGATETPELYFDAFEVVRHGRSTFYRVKEG